MTEQDLIAIQNIIGYKFKNICLLQQAFIRDSFVSENHEHRSNQNLVWIGEKVLANFLDQKLIAHYMKINELQELSLYNITFEEMIDKEDYFLSDTFIAKQVEMYNLSRYMVMGENDIKRKANKKYSVKKELFCAILGSVSIDSSSSPFSIKNVIDNILDIDYYLANGIDAINYVELLRKWTEMGSLHDARYVFNTSAIGGINNSVSQCTCFLDSLDHLFTGKGKSKAEARVDAAHIAYQYLEDNNLLYTLKDLVKDYDKEKAVTILQELANKGYIPQGEYQYTEKKDKLHDQVWEVSLEIPTLVAKKSALALTKREAKKEAAYQVLLELIK